ncbi:MAG: glycosyltransferase [Planctomycetota bacterium]
MRVAHVVVTYPPYRGGMGNVAHAYVEGLRRRGVDAAVFTPRVPGSEADPPFVHRLRPWLRSGQCAVLPTLLTATAAFDLVHLHFPFFGAAQFVALRRRMRRRPRLVLTYHMDASAGGLRGAVFAAHRRLLLPWIVRSADRVLVASRDYAAHAALERVRNVRAAVEEHPFGVDERRFAPGAESEARARLRLDSAPTVVFVGGLDRAHAFKGLDVLLQACAALRADVRVVVAGDGDQRPGYEDRARALGLADRARFLGSVSDEDLPDVYRAADVVAFPSVSRAEAFGLVALEAAASARPVVASDLPGVRTVVQAEQTGLLVDPGAVGPLAGALARVLADERLRRDLGARARARVEREFTLERALDRLQATYAAVLAE